MTAGSKRVDDPRSQRHSAENNIEMWAFSRCVLWKHLPGQLSVPDVGPRVSEDRLSACKVSLRVAWIYSKMRLGPCFDQSSLAPDGFWCGRERPMHEICRRCLEMWSANWRGWMCHQCGPFKENLDSKQAITVTKETILMHEGTQRTRRKKSCMQQD